MIPARYVDHLNIVLMLASFGLALLLPFQLFLFSYAVLGPLHYITEISWLRERDFFLRRRRQAWWLVAICFILSSQAIALSFYGDALDAWAVRHDSGWVTPVLWGQLVLGALIAVAFFFAVITHRTRHNQDFYIWLFLVAFIAMAAQIVLPYEYSFFSLMLPTIIHVSIFTALFILSGALKQGQSSGYAVFGLYIVLCVVFFIPGLLPIASEQPGSHDIYMASTFPQVNEVLLRSFSAIHRDDRLNILKHPMGLQVQAFIAFVYTYHYLNWFSKTSLVGWHHVPRKRLGVMAGLWIASMAVYLYDYRVGLSVLLFFSLLHVILEFPLNHRVMGQIALSLRDRLRRHA